MCAGASWLVESRTSENGKLCNICRMAKTSRLYKGFNIGLRKSAAFLATKNLGHLGYEASQSIQLVRLRQLATKR